MNFVKHIEMYFLASSYVRKSRGGLGVILFVQIRSENQPENGESLITMEHNKESLIHQSSRCKLKLNEWCGSERATWELAAIRQGQCCRFLEAAVYSRV